MDILKKEDVERIRQIDVSKLSEYELNKLKTSLEEYVNDPNRASNATAWKIIRYMLLGLFVLGSITVAICSIFIIIGVGAVGALFPIFFESFLIIMCLVLPNVKFKKSIEVSKRIKIDCGRKLEEVEIYMAKNGMNEARVAGVCDKCGYVYNGSESFCPKCGAARKIV